VAVEHRLRGHVPLARHPLEREMSIAPDREPVSRGVPIMKTKAGVWIAWRNNAGRISCAGAKVMAKNDLVPVEPAQTGEPELSHHLPSTRSGRRDRWSFLCQRAPFCLPAVDITLKKLNIYLAIDDERDSVRTGTPWARLADHDLKAHLNATQHQVI